MEWKEDKVICEEIFKALEQISYGEVVITKHDNKIVQIEKKKNKI